MFKKLVNKNSNGNKMIVSKHYSRCPKFRTNFFRSRMKTMKPQKVVKLILSSDDYCVVNNSEFVQSFCQNF